MFSVFPIKGNTFEVLGAFHSTKTFKNLKTGVNGTGIAGKSFQKFRKLNANHSTENSRNSESKGCPLFTKSLKTLFHSFFAENSDWKSGLNGKRPLSFFPLSLERPKFSVPFVWITCSAGSLLREREILSVFCKLYKSIQFQFSVRKAMVVYCLEHSIRKNSTTFSDVLFLPEIFQKECYIYFPMALYRNFLKNGKQPMSVSFAGKFSPKFPYKW